MLQTSARLLEARNLPIHAAAVRDAQPRNPETPIDLQDVARLCGLEAALSAFRALPQDQKYDGSKVARALALSYARRACRYWAMERPADTLWREYLRIGEGFQAGEVGSPTMSRAYEKLSDYGEELVRMATRKGKALEGRVASLVCAVNSLRWSLAPNILFDLYQCSTEALVAVEYWPCDHRSGDYTYTDLIDQSWRAAMRRSEVEIQTELYILATAYEVEPIPI
jgi:hypothetical protein